MTITVNTKDYSEDSSPNPNAVRYRGPNQTYSVVDNIEIKRTLPKKTATYNGNARSGIRITRSAVVNGETLVAFVNVDTSIPVGFPQADTTALVNDSGDLLASATGHAVVETQRLKF